MIGEWCYYESKFSPEFCKYIVDTALTLPSKDAGLGVSGLNEHSDSSYRRSDIRFIDKSDLRFQQLFDIIWKLGIESNDIWFNFHLSKLDYIQFAEYNEKQKGEYKRHHDVFWMNNDNKYHRKLSAIIQLTDPSEYEGGNLQFFEIDQQPNPDALKKLGTIIFFPSFIPHAVTPITKGKRHSLAIWFDGPKWK